MSSAKRGNGRRERPARQPAPESAERPEEGAPGVREDRGESAPSQAPPLGIDISWFAGDGLELRERGYLTGRIGHVGLSDGGADITTA
jgi:hypothetical protein